MQKRKDRLWHLIVAVLALLSAGLLLFLVAFMVQQSLPAIRSVGLYELLFGTEWRPVIYQTAPEYGLLHMLLSTLYVSALAVLFALGIGVGCSLFLACAVGDRLRAVCMPYVNLLAGIPSVVYGFVGLYVVVRTMEKLGRASGESVLAGSIVLSVMILPYMISSCLNTMVQIRRRVEKASAALGVSRWYMAGEIILPASWKGILISTALATGRAMGETMAVMMVMGNAVVRPTLLGKGETVSALIALEMGTAEVGSIHFSALYTAGLVLLLLLLAINWGFSLLRRRLIREDAE